jgi:hypothetical protein
MRLAAITIAIHSPALALSAGTISTTMRPAPNSTGLVIEKTNAAICMRVEGSGVTGCGKILGMASLSVGRGHRARGRRVSARESRGMFPPATEIRT